MTTINCYRVRWEVDIYARSPLDAARQAEAIMREPLDGDPAQARVMDVRSARGSGWTKIDLATHHSREQRILAEFVPQAWIGDIAMAVDPEGDTMFDVTNVVLAMGEPAARAMRDDQKETDHLRDAPTALAWMKAWSGPFRINVEDSIADYFDALAEEPVGI